MKVKSLISLLIIFIILLTSVNGLPTVSHPAEQVTAGTFDAGDFTFQGNLELNKGNEVFLNI
ncbi:hypothetical protein HYW99_04115, partial [Candidatus Woesearchaeota archaeon]|nr:hypothetical protein [Candidatus Woesearchaeota archaeon]